MNEDWTEKYRPDRPDQVVGNQDAVQEFLEWFENFDEDSPAAALHGPPGVGKTSLAMAVANEHGYETHIVDASDNRTRETIEEEVIDTVQSYPMQAEGRMVICDEADNLESSGKRAMNEAINKATEPLVLIANDYYDGLSKGMRNKCTEIEFEPLEQGDILQYLMWICDEEGINYTTDALRRIIQRSNGDVRAAVHDLQSSAQKMSTTITQSDVKQYYADERTTVAIVGPEDMEQPEAEEILRDTDIGGDKWVIRPNPSFDMVAGEYARDHGIDLDIELPKHFEEYTRDWNEINRIRLEDLIDYAENAAPVFEPDEPIDWDEYSRWVVLNTDTVYLVGDPDKKMKVLANRTPDHKLERIP